MADFDIRSDSVDVQAVMEQIRARLREKRGVDYTEQQIRELAAVKLERFLDPKAVRSDLLKEFRAARPAQLFVPFGPDPLFSARRPIVARIRRLLHPVLRLFFNPDPIVQALARINELATITVADENQYYELLHNLVVELTRTRIEVQNLQVRVDSLASRLDFDERRARALESAVVYRPTTPSASDAPENSAETEGPGQRNRRLWRRHARRGQPAAEIMGAAPGADAAPSSDTNSSREQPTTRDDQKNDPRAR
jgi:hypothetical protein